MSYLLVENRLSLSTITGLFAIVTAFSLGSNAILTLLVLRNLVQSVLPALLTLAVCLLSFWNVHLLKTTIRRVLKLFTKHDLTPNSTQQRHIPQSQI